MEMFELKYFLGVARDENIHRASEKLRVSPASLSKAIARLEDELSVSLFVREGRNIRLTDHGRLFQRRASEIVQLEEATRLELAGHEGAIQVVIAGPEILLTEMGMTVSAELKRKFPKGAFEFHSTADADAIGQVSRGEAHLALVTSDVPSHLGLTTQVLSEPHFLRSWEKAIPCLLLRVPKKRWRSNGFLNSRLSVRTIRCSEESVLDNP